MFWRYVIVDSSQAQLEKIYVENVFWRYVIVDSSQAKEEIALRNSWFDVLN